MSRVSKIAVIFDMDGVLVENSSVHEKAWRMIIEKYGKKASGEEVKNIFGGTNKMFVERFLGITDDKKINEIAVEKEALYREIFSNDIKAPDGLLNLLFELKKNNVRLAVATSAPTINLDFVLDKLEIRGFFDVLVDETYVKNAKPDPEIYLVASKKLGVDPENCVVIEDSIFGIQSALAAGMKVIGITTTFPFERINFSDKVINRFDEIGISDIELLLETVSNE